ncbi:MAG: hypothetical protein GXY53_05460, partial [Desulfobulbus sp.]|nr:hypothetical protein [Desulfobulbus sp.]
MGSEAALAPSGKATIQGYGLTVCLTWNRMLIHRKTIRVLGQPERVRLLINPDTRHFCVQGCDKTEPCSFVVPREMSPVYDPFYIHSKFLLGQLYTLMGWNPEVSYRVFGRINSSPPIMDFDLNRYVQVNAEEHLENDEMPEEWTREHRPVSAPEKQEVAGSRTAESSLVLPASEMVRPAPSREPGKFLGSLFDTVQFHGKKEAP